MRPRVVRAFEKVIRLNLKSPKTLRVAIIRSIPVFIAGPHDLTGIEQIAECDTVSLLVQVGSVVYSLKNKSYL